MPIATRQSWGSRLGNSLKGLIVGLILFLLAFPLPFWNEGRAARRQRALEEGTARVASVTSDRVESGNEGQLIYVSGAATVSETLSDGQFETCRDRVAAAPAGRDVSVEVRPGEQGTKEARGWHRDRQHHTYSKTWREGTIAVAWLEYRPLLGGTLLAIALLCLVVTVRRLGPQPVSEA